MEIINTILNKGKANYQGPSGVIRRIGQSGISILVNSRKMENPCELSSHVPRPQAVHAYHSSSSSSTLTSSIPASDGAFQDDGEEG